MKFTPGDIVANTFGHVLAISHTLEDGTVVAFYECQPNFHHRYQSNELRLLSRSRGVNMEVWNSSEFADRVRRSMEWARGVKGLPKKYRMEVPRKRTKKEVTASDIAGLTTEQLVELLKGGPNEYVE